MTAIAPGATSSVLLVIGSPDGVSLGTGLIGIVSRPGAGDGAEAGISDRDGVGPVLSMT